MSPDDARHCQRLTRAHARTFHLASLLLPEAKRRATYALYAFCRVADDLVDTPDPASDVSRRATQLDAYRRQLEHALTGAPDGPVFRELAWTVARYAVPPAVLHELLDGVATDLTRSDWTCWSELEHYCQGVAGSVGEMCARVFGAQAPVATQAAMIARARSLGVAMQLTNILRDVGEDAQRGRCYLPADELALHSLTPELILHQELQPTDPRWQSLMTFQIARARRYFAIASPGIALLDADAQRCARACAVGYARILTAIERNGHDSLHRRARLGWTERAAVWMQSLFGGGPLGAPDLTAEDAAPIRAA